jgi:hypothetical protein
MASMLNPYGIPVPFTTTARLPHPPPRLQALCSTFFFAGSRLCARTRSHIKHAVGLHLPASAAHVARVAHLDRHGAVAARPVTSRRVVHRGSMHPSVTSALRAIQQVAGLYGLPAVVCSHVNPPWRASRQSALCCNMKPPPGCDERRLDSQGSPGWGQERTRVVCGRSSHDGVSSIAPHYRIPAPPRQHFISVFWTAGKGCACARSLVRRMIAP